MANKQVSLKPAKAATTQPANETPVLNVPIEDLRLALFEAESRIADYAKTAGNSQMARLVQFAELARNFLAEHQSRDSEATIEYLARSLAEIWAEVKAITSQPAPVFKPAPLSAKYAATLNQQPVISPAFASTLECIAQNCLHEWMKENAPAHIFELFRSASGLRRYEGEYRDGQGFVSADANSSIMDYMADCINGLDAAGNEWIDSV